MFVLKNRLAPKLSEANCHARLRLSHWKQLLKNIHPLMLASSCSVTKKCVHWPYRKHRMTDWHCTYIHQPRKKTSWQNACAQN